MERAGRPRKLHSITLEVGQPSALQVNIYRSVGRYTRIGLAICGAFSWSCCLWLEKIRILILKRLVTHPHFLRTDCASAHLTVQFHSSVLTIRIEIIIGHKASMTI